MPNVVSFEEGNMRARLPNVVSFEGKMGDVLGRFQMFSIPHYRFINSHMQCAGLILGFFNKTRIEKFFARDLNGVVNMRISV